MADQPNPPVEEAAADTPDAGTGTTEEVNWQERYQNLQPEYTRASQEAAELRRKVQQYDDPEYRAQLFRELAQEQGYEIQDPEQEPSDFEFRDPRVDEIQQQLARQEQERQQEQQLEYLDQIVETELGKLPGDLPSAAREWITSRALAMNPLEGPNGIPVPDIQGAYREFNDGLVTELKKSWASTKRAPHVSANGQAGTQAKNTDEMSLDELQAWQEQRLADLSAD